MKEYLRRFDGPVIDLASIIADVWRKLPLGVRRRLLKHWREHPQRPDAGHWPAITLEVDDGPQRNGNATNAGRAAVAGVDHFGVRLSFSPAITACRYDIEVASTVAHELAHAYLIASGHESQTAELAAYDERGFSQGEYEADKLATAWGFYQPKPRGARRKKKPRKDRPVG